MILCVGLSPALQRTQFFQNFAPGEVNRAERTLYSASGKGLNVARALVGLGVPATLVQPLGGPTGELFARLAEQSGVPQIVVGVPSLTRICTTLISSSGVTELVEEAAPLPPEAVKALVEATLKHLDGASALCLTGSLPPGVQDDFYAALIVAAHKSKKPTLLDAQKLPLRLALAQKPHLVKINRGEAAAMLSLPEIADSATLCGLLQQAGAQNAIVTDGEHGATLAESSGALWHVTPPEGLEIVNPIGSGDCMNAGILAALTRGQSLPEALRWGTACAAANCLTPTSGLFDPNLVPVLREKTAIAAYRQAV